MNEKFAEVMLIMSSMRMLGLRNVHNFWFNCLLVGSSQIPLELGLSITTLVALMFLKVLGGRLLVGYQIDVVLIYSLIFIHCIGLIYVLRLVHVGFLWG